MRPTRHRLLSAMGISACIVAVLLALVGSLVDFAEHGGRLTILIRNGGGEPNSNVTTGDQPVHSSPQEESRTSMWRQSHSIMFQPGSDIVVREEESILSDFRFKPRVYVVGLGVTIGSCFIGIPLAGVPVEQRTVAISLFVCARNSG